MGTWEIEDLEYEAARAVRRSVVEECREELRKLGKGKKTRKGKNRYRPRERKS